MSEVDITWNPQRARATRRLDGESGAPSSVVAPIWDPAARLQPLVMVVDDSPAVRRVVELTLGRQGISTASYPGGLELLSALQSSQVAPPKVLLLDIGMPRMNGYRVARLLRSNPGFRDTKLFMLTAHDGVLDRALVALLGVGFIAKPFKSAELVRIVREALNMPLQEERWR